MCVHPAAPVPLPLGSAEGTRRGLAHRQWPQTLPLQGQGPYGGCLGGLQRAWPGWPLESQEGRGAGGLRALGGSEGLAFCTCH